MIPLSKLPPDVQKAILTLLVISGGATVTSCFVPPICDPAPPPRSATPQIPPTLTRSPVICDIAPIPRTSTPPQVTPTVPRTPILCDPAPPPRTPSPSRTMPPIICDPMPPRSLTPPPSSVATPATARRFQIKNLQMTTDNTIPGATVRGNIYDAQGKPLSGVRVSVQSAGAIIDATTDRNGTYAIRISAPGNYSIVVGDDKNSALSLRLAQFDVANVDWVAVDQTSHTTLPLAEIRTIDILWNDSLTFGVDNPWHGARLRWSVSGGQLIEQAEDTVTWEPPNVPGRYLLQVIADWGAAGIAVDSMILTLNVDGSITYA